MHLFIHSLVQCPAHHMTGTTPWSPPLVVSLFLQQTKHLSSI